jgi:Tol biopolymer transport system component
MDVCHRRIFARTGWLALLLLLRASAFSDSIQLVSSLDHLAATAGGNGDSSQPVLTPDGRFVLYASSANNLMLTSNGIPIPSLIPARLNVYLRDRTNQTATLVSINTNGGAGGNDNSFPVALSTNWQFALFESSASDLGPGDTNKASDIFLRDLVNGVTWLVSSSTNGLPGNGASRSAVMTPDGRYVAFVSEAFNLVANDTNKIADVFVRDMQTLTTTLISVGAISTNSVASMPASCSDSPEITPDGRFVAFSSTATNLVPGLRSAGDIYVHDRMAGTNLWVSSGMRVNLAAVTGQTNGICSTLALSADGKFVAYQGSVSPLGSGVNSGIILRYNLDTGITDLIHTNAPISTTACNLDLTPDGGVAAFVANSNDASGTTTCVQLWDAASGATTLVSGDLSGMVTSNSISSRPVMDPSGRYVVFLSNATNLVANPTPGTWHLYLRDLLAATTTLVDADTNGAGAYPTAVTVPCLSDDARYVAFESGDGGLVADDNNHNLDVFVRDLIAGTNELISAHDPTLGTISPNGPSLMSLFSASADGRYIAYASEADNLVTGDTNGVRDVFVRDLAGNTNWLVSSDPDGVPGNGISTEPAISGNGRYVAFTSGATNLVVGDTNNATDIFVRDLWTGLTTLESLKSNGVTPASGNSHSPSLSTDGRWVLFRSQAKDLANGNFTGTENLLLRDRQSATNWALTTAGVYGEAMTPDGRFVAFLGSVSGFANQYLYVWDSALSTLVYTNTTGNIYSTFAISPDGNRIAFYTTTQMRIADRAAQTNWLVASITPNFSWSAAPQLSADGNWLTYSRYVSPWTQTYLYDVQNRIELLVSHAMNSTAGGGGNSDGPDISPDGRFVSYRTTATNVVAGGNGLIRQIILYDRQTGSNALVSASRFTGAPADDHSLRASFSLDGQTLLFQSWASDLVANDANQSGDVFAHTILTVVIFPPGVPGQGAWISWPYVPGNNYDVQFKHSLDDLLWQSLSGTITNLGTKAWMQDVAPDAAHRFYRIRSF